MNLDVPVEIDEEMVERVIGNKLEETGAAFGMDEDVDHFHDTIPMDLAEDLANDVTETIQDVPEGAMIQRIVIDAPDDIHVYYQTDEDVDADSEDGE